MISVVIPVYNGAQTIVESIESALCQDVECEIIVIDDCSTDDTGDVIRPYIDQNLIRYYKNETNRGVSESRNIGVNMARGEFIAYLDADDAWLPGKLSAQLKRLEETNDVMCSTSRRLRCGGSSKDGRVIHMPERVNYKQLLGGNCIACSSVVIKTEVAKEFPMVCDTVHEDYLTWLKILQKYDTCSGVDKPYLLYTLSTTGKSGNKFHSAAMTFGVYRKLGMPVLKSCICFARYALRGVRNYYGPDQ